METMRRVELEYNQLYKKNRNCGVTDAHEHPASTMHKKDCGTLPCLLLLLLLLRDINTHRHAVKLEVLHLKDEIQFGLLDS